jgi:hypothetical protein
MLSAIRINNFRALFRLILERSEKVSLSNSEPRMTLTCPDDDQIWRWVSKYDDTVLEHGLMRLQSKVVQGKITDSDSAGRFLTAVFSSETRRRQSGGAQ